MKKLILALLLVSLFLCACGKTETPQTAVPDTQAPAETTEAQAKAPETAEAPAETAAAETSAPVETSAPAITTAAAETEKPAETTAPAAAEVPAGTATVVYLKNAGKGDGKSAENPVGTLNDALDALDLSKDCTVVLCGKYAQNDAFVYTKTFDGSVTITSNYGGHDYRADGAVLTSPGVRFVCSGEYVFKDLDITLLGNFFYIIGNYHPVTVDTGVTVKSVNLDFNGQKFANSFSILGGCQVGQPEIVDGEAPTADSKKDTHITVRSACNINIGAYGRQIADEFDAGNAYITVGGNAVVTKLYLTPCNKPFISGKTTVTVEENGVVEEIYGATSTGTADSFTVNWLGGTIGKYAVGLSEGNAATLTNGSTLNYAKAVESQSSFAEVKMMFDKANAK